MARRAGSSKRAAASSSPAAPPPRDPPSPPPMIPPPILRRFVFQTFGHARRTQDSPIMPDVWMRYIRRAEKCVRARIGKLKPVPSCALDLLLTPWLDTRAGDLATALREKLKSQRDARIAESTSRVVAHLEFHPLIRVVMPMTGWCQELWGKFEKLREAFSPLYNQGSPGADLFSRLFRASAGEN